MRATTLLSLLPFAAAVPNVTVIPLGSKDCSSWPAQIRSPGADISRYLRIEITSPEDVGLTGLLSTSSTQNWPTVGNLSNTEDYVSFDVRRSTYFAKPVFRCSNGTLHMNSPDFEPISVSRDYRGAWMMLGEFADGPGYKLEPYAHELDGVRQEGVFLGAKGKTTWGFAYERAEVCGGLPDWYTARLMGLEIDPTVNDRAWGEIQSKGFLRVFEWV
ncbi:hypothetical protein V8F06_009476 [Rhypophila decipiens]